MAGAKKKQGALQEPSKGKKDPPEGKWEPNNGESRNRELRKLGNGLDESIRPVDDVFAAMTHMVNKMKDDPTLAKVGILANKGGMVFRVGTMCSGTEAPIFALEMLQEAYYCANLNELFRFQHVFGVEIEPYKQAYIRRNTSAKVYRDVREFVSDDMP